MEILLYDANKKLLQEYGFLIYKANRAADKNKWKTFQKYSDLAARKLGKITRNLGIDTNKYSVTPKYIYAALVVSEKNEVQS